MFTKEELEAIEENLGSEWRKKIELLLEDAQRGKQIEAELTGELQKIFMNPEAKKHFQEALKKANISVPIPETPFDNIYEELEKTKSEVKKVSKEMEEREKIRKALEEYGITEDEYEDLIKFQKEHKIYDNLKAIELYAKLKKVKEQYEFEPVKKISIKPPEEYTVEDAYKKTIEDLRKEGLIRR